MDNMTKVSTNSNFYIGDLNFRMSNLTNMSTHSYFRVSNLINISTHSYFRMSNLTNVSTHLYFRMSNLTNVSTHSKFRMSNLTNTSTHLNFHKSNLTNVFTHSKFHMNNITSVSTHSKFRMNNLAIQPQYNKPNLSTNFVPLSRGCYNPHLTLLMLPYCTEKADFVQFIDRIYNFIAFVTKHVFKLFLLIYQSIPCTIINFADKYSEILNWISYLKIISDLPCWSFSELVLSIHQNIMHRHDFSALKIKFYYYALKKQYRCKIYAQKLLFCLLKCRKLRIRLKTSKNKIKYLPLKPKTAVPSAKCMPINSHISSQPIHQKKNYYGGHRIRTFSYDFLEPYLTPGYPNTLDMRGRYLYINHVNDISLCLYPTENFVHTQIPLEILLPFLTLTHARKIALVHGIKAGSRCNMKILLAKFENHSCLACNCSFSIFHISKSANQLASIRMNKMRNINKYKNEKKKSLTNTKTFKQLNNQKNTNNNIFSFPPSVPDKNLYHQIISGAVEKMDPKNIEEAGCAVCGLLKPLCELSRLKNVKKLLHILQQEGITRVERKTKEEKVHEYSGPVLDYSCSKICNDCRISVRKGKVPRLALAKGLWLGKVPDELKSLRFVEKLLIARVRHTCCYVKVASGMRKMKANVIAFQTPIPKVYDILPPPCAEMNEVLAILFTGPCKPTESDLSRTPFLVRRNHVAKALDWLRLNHSDYADIKISKKNLDEYPEHEIPVSIEYMPSETNKVPEGTSIFDTEPEDGTDSGECSFTVHGLTGDMLDTMTTNTIKAMALRHLNNEGKMLAIGHSKEFESMWNNPQLYPQMFPWLFPYGMGGIGTTNISDKEHKKWLLMYHDKRFQTDINFPFVAFSHSQMKQSSTQSFLLVDQARFQNITQRLLNLDQNVLSNITEKLSNGEYFVPESDSEKACFQVLRDLDHVAGKVKGSTTSKKYMRNEIWSLIAFSGAPSWYITLSPADIQHPICIYYADSKEEFKPNLLPYNERIRMVCKNPVAGARFFNFMIETFITDVLGVGSNHRGLYGDTKAFYGTVEQQGRLTLHLHMLLWIKGCLNPQEMREKILRSDSEWNQKIIDWLESCHSGEFLTGTQEEVSNKVSENMNNVNYTDPTQILPLHPPKLCEINHIVVNSSNKEKPTNCLDCSKWSSWWTCVINTIDDLLFKSNVHNCDHNLNKNGSKKNTSSGCKDNKWGKCKARFPRPLFIKSQLIL